MPSTYNAHVIFKKTYFNLNLFMPYKRDIHISLMINYMKSMEYY